MKIIALLFAAVILLAAAYAKQECDYSAEIILESNEFASEDFKFRIKAVKIEGPSTNITAQISITNYNNTPVKSYKPWTNSPISRQKTSSEYSPNLEEGNYEITAEIFVLCDDFEKENNLDKKKIIIKSSSSNTEKMMMDDKTEDTKPQENKTILPFNDYDEKFSESANAQPAASEEIISIENQESQKSLEEMINEQSQKNNLSEEKIINSQSLKNQSSAENIIYKSSGEKAKGLVLIMLLAVSIGLNIILIWKR